MPSKRTELANILRRLAEYVDSHPDENLTPIFEQAATLMRSSGSKKRLAHIGKPNVRAIAAELQTLTSRDIGDELLKAKSQNRKDLEAIARFLQLPVQRDDTVERLRAKIVENTIGSRLRSDAIQGKNG